MSVAPNPLAVFRISSLVECFTRVKGPNCCLSRSLANSNGLGVGVGVGVEIGEFSLAVKLQSLQAKKSNTMITRLGIDFI